MWCPPILYIHRSVEKALHKEIKDIIKKQQGTIAGKLRLTLNHSRNEDGVIKGTVWINKTVSIGPPPPCCSVINRGSLRSQKRDVYGPKLCCDFQFFP